MQINGVQNIQGISAAGGANRATRAAGPAASSAPSSLAPVDQLDLSPEAQALSGAKATGATQGPAAAEGEIRVDRVAALRRAIAEGNYDTPEKVSAALDKFLDQYV